MPIRIDPVVATNPITLKAAVDKIAREAQALQRPSAGDNLFVTSVPTVDDLIEGQLAFYFDGASTYRMYTKINGVLKFLSLT